MARITLTVETDERDALIELARIEKRDPRAQGAMLLRESLERRGLLPLINAMAIDRNAAQQTGAIQNATA